jgi:hypothetical protein
LHVLIVIDVNFEFILDVKIIFSIFFSLMIFQKKKKLWLLSRPDVTELFESGWNLVFWLESC